ncbi:hypothetical protein AKO1_009164 [Acrasis kona]|uniref:Transmembrane protein n=1 Tax=Acrasis kona TaxID=1008807 RepID=A0AAW2ZL80_9EUKA
MNLKTVAAVLVLVFLALVLAQTNTETPTPTLITTATPTPTPSATNATSPPATKAPYKFDMATEGATVIVLTCVMVGIAVFLCGCVVVGDNIVYIAQKKRRAAKLQ